MSRTSRLIRLDAFSKTVEDARVRTTSGGIVTICAIAIVLFLVGGEIRDYRKVEIQPELEVDKSRGEQLPIHINITFPHVPCHLVTLDVMDVSGEQQNSVKHGIHLTRLSPYPKSQPLSVSQLDLHKDVAEHLDPNYCGACYGANPAEGTKCCNTCEDVRDAYARHGWAFGTGDHVEQCEREHYAEHLASEREEGCNVAGHLSVNKVVGNFHIAPGKSFSTPNMHVHDLDQYFSSPKEHRFSHIIHSLNFGPEITGTDTSGVGNPLDRSSRHTKERAYNYVYFVKVVSTSFISLDGMRTDSHQYSVTSHERSLIGGADKEHPGTLHARGGIPGVFFSYDISPMRVINREVRNHSFLGLLAGICATIGGTLTVATVIDRTVYEGGMKMRKLHQG